MRVWIVLGTITTLFLIALVVLMFRLNKQIRREPDYYLFFIMGIIWIGAGTAIFSSSGNPGLLAMGVIFTAMGLSNKRKWKENRRRFNDLTPEEKKLKKWIVVVLAALMLLGIAAYYLA